MYLIVIIMPMKWDMYLFEYFLYIFAIKCDCH